MNGLPDPNSAYGLFIGVECYDNPAYGPLPGSRAAVGQLADMVAKPDPDGLMWRLPSDRVCVLGRDDGRVPLAQARAALTDAAWRPGLDSLLVCVSCHGFQYPHDGVNPDGLHLAMSDSDQKDPSSHLRFDDIYYQLEVAHRRRGVRHILLIVDTCFAEGARVRPGQGGPDAAEIDHLAVPGVVVLTATRYHTEAWPHWRDTPWTAFLGALIETVHVGDPGPRPILTAKNVFHIAKGRLAEARRDEDRIPEPYISGYDESEIPLCRNRAFSPPLKAHAGRGPASTVEFDHADDCFTAIREAHRDGHDDAIPGLLRSLCGRAEVPVGEVARMAQLLASSEFADYLPHAYVTAWAKRTVTDMALLACRLHRADKSLDKLMTALRGRERGGHDAVLLYRSMLDGRCPDCPAAAELVAAHIAADPELAAGALAVWL
jgi:hypothetical protein